MNTNKIRIGMDIGGVIRGDFDQSLSMQEYLSETLLANATNVIKDIIDVFGAKNIFIISRCPKFAEEVIIKWLDNQNMFKNIGFIRKNVFFCRERTDKALIAKRLKLTYFIDDRVEVLDAMNNIVNNRILFTRVHKSNTPVDSRILCLDSWNLIHDFIKKNESLFSPEEIRKTIQHLSETLNDKVEYYVGGGLAIYILTGLDLDRNFSDIDIMIPELEIINTKESFEASNFEFWDERFIHRKRIDLIEGHHEYGALDKSTGVRIGIYTFESLGDKRIMFRNHFGELDGRGNLIDRVRETKLPIEISKVDLFSADPIRYMNRDVYTVTPEQIYIRKKTGTRIKDIYDLQKILSMLSPDKLKRIETAISAIETNIK